MRDVTENAVKIELDEDILRESAHGLRDLGRSIKEMLIGLDALCGGLAAQKGLDIDKVADDVERAVLVGMMACDALAYTLKEMEDDE